MVTVSPNDKLAVWDYAGLAQINIDRPAEAVWHHFFGDRKTLWANTRYAPVAGRTGEVGEIYANPYQGGRLLYEAITVKPAQQLILKITWQEHEQEDPGAGELVGYDLITLQEGSGHTAVSLQQVFTLRVPRLEATLSLESERQDAMLASILRNLKVVVETSQ